MPESTSASTPSTLSERPCPFITFYSFRGGVGRSMAAINVAGIIASRGFRVLLVDMDLEAPGLSFLARPGQPGVVDLLLDAVERGPQGDLFQLSAVEAVSRYSAPYELPEGLRRTAEGTLRIMPAGQLDADYPGRLDRLRLPVLHQEGTSRALIKAFKQVIQDAASFDHVIIDSRAGFSGESGICTRDLADYLMVVSGLNKQNVEGTASFLSALRLATHEQKPLQVILGPIPNGQDALVEQREARAQAAFLEAWGEPVPTDLHIPYHPQLALTEDQHICQWRRGHLFEAYTRIERRLMRLLGETWDDAFASAIDAFSDNDFAAAAVGFRRASKLADTQEWPDQSMYWLTPALAAEDGVEAVFGLILEHASAPAKHRLGRRFAKAASACSDGPDRADTLYERALQADPTNAVNLGSYASFLWAERDDLDAAELIYKRALAIDPNNDVNLNDYANFLWEARQDLDAAEQIYQRVLAISPTDAVALGNYANFLWKERKDLDAAELLHKRAAAADPTDDGNLGNYADFLWIERQDPEAAELMYRQALDAAPNDADNLGNYGRFCLTLGRVREGMQQVDRALEIQAGAHAPEAVDAECWMYVYCCGEPGRQLEALQQLRALVEVHAVSTEEWDFAGVIRQAGAMGHPEHTWLPTLAEVLGGRQPPTTLDDWPAWRSVAPN